MNMIGARKAALAMAAMHPADRRWMLEHLPKAWRPVLGPLMKQARQFVSIETEVLQAALDDESLAQVIEIPAPGLLIAVLDTLSVQWAARALAATASDHTELYLAACSKQRVDSIRHELGRLSRPFPSALAEAMARCLNDAGQVLAATEALR